MEKTKPLSRSPALTRRDLERAEGVAIAMAQATIQNAMDGANITKAELARRLRKKPPYITRMMQSDHNLTIRTFSGALAVCGFEVDFELAPLGQSWSLAPVQRTFYRSRPQASVTPPILGGVPTWSARPDFAGTLPLVGSLDSRGD